MGEVFGRAGRAGFWGGAGAAGAMVVYAIILKIINQQSGPSTIGYYIVFPLALMAAVFFARTVVASRLYTLGLVMTGVIAAFVGSAFYNVWVVINTRLIVGGPIRQLVVTHEDYLARAAAGEDVAQELAVIERFMESPEFFAFNVFVRLFILFAPVAVIAALFMRFFVKVDE